MSRCRQRDAGHRSAGRRTFSRE